MKKLTALILILCMACMLIPAGAEEADIPGDWYMSGYTSGEASFDPSLIGIHWIFTFNEDGTVDSIMTYQEDTQANSGTWKLENGTLTITVEDTPMECQMAEDGTFTVNLSESEKGVFSKGTYSEAEPVPAESEEAFFGSWELSAVDYEGVRISKEMFDMVGMTGLQVYLVIESGKATLATQTSEDGELQGGEITTTFEDGKLTVPLLDGTTSPIELMSDGTIRFMFGEMPVYLVPMTEEAEEPAA